jgi:hypothetical protein
MMVFQLQVSEPLQGLHDAPVLRAGIAEDLVQLPVHDREFQALQFVVEWGHDFFFSGSRIKLS